MAPASHVGQSLFRGGVIGLLAASMAGCHRGGEAAATGSAPITVTVETAKPQTLRDTVVAQGIIVPAPSAVYNVIAPQSSKIVELPKLEGATVKPGDVLARFDLSSSSAGLGAQALEVEEADRKLEAAKAEYAKQSALYAKGYTSRNDYTAAKAALDVAQRAVDEFSAETTAAAELNTRSVVRAPFGGVVLHVYKAVGDVADLTTNATVLQLADPTLVQVAVQVTPAQELRLAAGQPATVTVTGTAETQAGTVIVAPPVMSDEVKPTLEARLSLSGTPPALGTPVTAEIVVDQRDHVVAVPEQAISKDDSGTFVLIAGPDGRAHRRDVQTGLVAAHLAEIKSGVTDGDEVIITALDQVTDNAPIQIDRGR